MSEQDPTRPTPQQPEDPTVAGGGGPAEEPTTAFSGATAVGAPAAYGAPRRLQRSRQRRVVAGVAGGLGEYTGVDPVLYRVVFAVLTVFGGAGILLYVLGWLFLPDQDQPASPAESLLGRGAGPGSRAREAAQGIGLAIAALVLAGILVSGDAGDVVLVGVLVIGGVLLARHLDDRRSGSPPPSAAPPSPPPPQPYQAYQAYDQPAGTATATLPPVPVPKPPKQRSVLSLLTISLVLLAVGVLAAIDVASGDDAVQPRHYLALALGLVGAGMIAGAFRGRARRLIWVGVPLSVALLAATNAEGALDGGTGDRRYAPATAEEVQDRYELGAGNLLVDLTGVDFAGRSVSTDVDLGIGDVEVRVPPNVDVTVTGRSQIGEVEVFGRRVNGTDSERTLTDQGVDGPGGGTLELRVEIGIGKVEVDREAP